MSGVLAIIPARGGSKGIPGKNLAACGGRPLVDWTIEAACAARYVDWAVLSSDDDAILARAGDGIIPHRRPAELAQDHTPTEPVIADAIDAFVRSQRIVPDILVLLQPTSPLRTGQHIDEAITLLRVTARDSVVDYRDSVVSVVPSHAYLWTAEGPLYTERRRRQDMEQYEENGAIYATTMEQWRRSGDRLGGRVALYIMSEEHRYQVDSPEDLEVLSRLLERRAVAA